MSNQRLRAGVLRAIGANEAQVQELLAYNENRFVHDPSLIGSTFPLADEPFVSAWQGYAKHAEVAGLPVALREAIVQLNFPVCEGMSEDPSYRAATRRGQSPAGSAPATHLSWLEPDRLQLFVHPTPAGRIPVIATGHRKDFENLVRALTARNEPSQIPRSMGALMVAGYNNWQRIEQYKTKWQAEHDAARWPEEFKRLRARPELYQDRFIVLSEGPYSGVQASSLGLDERRWLELSVDIRLNHECAHYFSKRVLSSMQNNLLDELIADYMGLVAATGRFHANWFLHFLGLEQPASYRSGGRLENYRGDPPLSEDAFTLLQELTRKAAAALENFDKTLPSQRSITDTGRALNALTQLTLEELADDGATARISALM